MLTDQRPVRPARSVLAALLLFLAAVPAPPVDAADVPGVSLLSGIHQLRIALGNGERFTLDLEPGVRFRRATALDDGWITAGVRDERTLLLIRSHAATDRPERIPAPAPGGALVTDPLPVVRDGRLEGLAWLAGDGARTLGARYAEWLGDGWGSTETVSAPGPGSQLALAGTAVGEDGVLLVWSAFDGSDDEIVWALRSGGSWSEPARVAEDNRVPDVTPTVTVLRGRPVAAWSRYDGQGYRLVVSRLVGDGWTAPEPYGPSGSLFPELVPFSADPADGGLLLFRDVPSGVWTVLRLDGNLRPVARASVESSGDVEPAVTDVDAEGLKVVPDPRRPAVEMSWQEP